MKQHGRKHRQEAATAGKTNGKRGRHKRNSRKQHGRKHRQGAATAGKTNGKQLRNQLCQLGSDRTHEDRGL
jgi:hypothetical protein